jgi:agmatinase
MVDWQDPGLFLDIEGAEAQRENAKYCILPVPYERTTCYSKGTEDGPAAILAASHHVELHDEELDRETWKEVGIWTAPPLLSDAVPSDYSAQLAARVGEILDGDHFPMILGGEHALTPMCIRGVVKRIPELVMLQIDAHADLRDEYLGSAFSHACAARRTVDQGVPVVQVGIRSVSEDERFMLEDDNVTCFLAHANRDVRQLIPKMLDALGDRPVYITLDVDGMDPGIMPGTGTPMAGGFSWWETLDILRATFEQKNVVAMDVVEVAPMAGNTITEFNAAKLIYRAIGYHAFLSAEA